MIFIKQKRAYLLILHFSQTRIICEKIHIIQNQSKKEVQKLTSSCFCNFSFTNKKGEKKKENHFVLVSCKNKVTYYDQYMVSDVIHVISQMRDVTFL